MSEIIIYPDVLDAGMTFLRAQLALRAEGYVTGTTVGSYLPNPHPDLPFVWMRRVGGFTTGRAVDRARLDVHVYHENEYEAHQLTQMTRGILLAWPFLDSSVAKAASEFSGPGPVLDPLWPDAARFFFTVEINLRGVPA
jgi:hypothetical protein